MRKAPGRDRGHAQPVVADSLEAAWDGKARTNERFHDLHFGY